MKRSAKLILLGLAGVVLLSAGAIIARQSALPQGGVAKIYQHGVLIKEIALDKVEVGFSFTVATDSGGTNTISVERGRIRISAASCPDQVCVNQGWIADGTVPVVCLPHGLIIEIVGGGEAFDAAAG